MPKFQGFNTINQYKRFTLQDEALIKRDLLNAFLIRRGEKPGRPGYGTTLWDYIFDNQTSEVTSEILEEVKRVIRDDRRINLLDAVLYPQDNGVLIEVEVSFLNSANAETMRIYFDEQNFQATYV